MTDKGAHVLCEALKHDCGLLSLDISNNNMTRKAATLFSSLMQSHPRLESVDLRGNAEVSQEILFQLASAPFLFPFLLCAFYTSIQ